MLFDKRLGKGFIEMSDIFLLIILKSQSQSLEEIIWNAQAGIISAIFNAS